MRGTTAAEWRALVYRYRGPGVGNGVRVLLIYLADHMRPNRTVSVPRSTIARDLGISTAEVTKRMKAAKDAGLLDPVQRGRPGVTAVYQGLFPSPVRGMGNPTSGVTPGLPSETAQHGMGNPTSKPPVRGNPGVAATIKRSESKAVVLGTTAEGSTTTAPRQSSDDEFFEDDSSHPSMMSDGVDHRETRRAPIDARQASTLDMEGNEYMVNGVDRETRRALLDALQASASDTYLNEDAADLLNKVADGLGDWAACKWTLPPAAATNRYIAGRQLNMILKTWEAAA